MNIEQQIEDEKVKRLFRWYSEKKPGPIKIDIEPHRRCNLFCLSCSRRVDPDFIHINEKTKELEMPVEKWISIVNEAADLGVMQWHIAGGGDPPMLADVTFPIMQEIKKRNMHGILTTNGTNIDDVNIKKIVDMGWDRIHFSIDGPNPKTHDYLRGSKGCFEKAIVTIKKIKKYRDLKKSNTPHLNMNTVLSTKNFDKLDKMVELAHELGIEYMFVEPLIVYSKWGEKLKLKDEHLKTFPKHLKKAINLANKFKIDSNFSHLDKNLDLKLIKKTSAMNEVVKEEMEKMEQVTNPLLRVPCYDPWYHMTIKVNGRTISCDVATDEGDSIKKKSLKEIWLGPYFEKHRTMLMSKNIPEFCKQCNPSHTTQRKRLRKEIEENITQKKSKKIKQNVFVKWMKKLIDW